MKKETGTNSTLLIASGVFIIVIVFLIALQKRNLSLTQTVSVTPEVQKQEDLNTLNSQLDEQNLDQIDKQLNQIDSDASSF